MTPKRRVFVILIGYCSFLFIFWVFTKQSLKKETPEDIAYWSTIKRLYQNHYSDDLKSTNLEDLREYVRQKSVTPREERILKKTLRFMIERRDEEDPELVAFVKTLIVPPFPESERKLTSDQTDFSQIGQSKYFDKMLGQKRGGFYVEAGGYDGQSLSNSLFFELERGWNGILIEAVKDLFVQILNKKRHAYAINACIADKVIVGKFLYFGTDVLSGLDIMGKKYKDRGFSESGQKVKNIFTPCFSLVTILKAIEVKTVDYFSLDVEGAECLVLDTFNFNKLDITSFSIEHSFYPETLECIRKTMLKSNYNETAVVSHDVYYKKLN